MSQVRRIAAAVALALGASAVAAHAQLPGLPVFPAPSGMGFMVAADAGFGDAANSYALTGGIAMGRLGFTASIGSSDFDVLNSSEVTYGAQAGIHLVGGGLNPLSVGVQAGYAGVDMGVETVNRIPVGANVRFTPPMFPLKPWGVAYYDLGDGEEFRFSVGVDFNLLPGLGLHAAYDWGDTGTEQLGAFYSIGAHFKFGAR